MAIALHHSRAQGSARLVLIGIANHAGDGGAWPALSTLAKYAGISRDNARKAVRRLEELGEVKVDINGGGDLSAAYYERPNRYHFKLACPSTCDRSSQHRVRGEVTIDLPSETMPPPVFTDSTDTPPPIADVPQGGIGSDALTVHEPITKTSRVTTRDCPSRTRGDHLWTGGRCAYCAVHEDDVGASA